MNDRIKFIDGIRGFAVLFVAFCHFTSMFLPAVKEATNAAGTIFNHTPLAFVIYGSASVQCFFLLSGFLIASNIHNNGLNHYSPLKTYKKLLRIVLPAVVLSFLLMVFGLVYHTKAADIYPELSYAYWYNNFTPTIGSMLKDIFFSTFFKCSSQYVPPFWTIGYEFVGTIGITLLSYFTSQHKKQNQIIFYFVLCIIILFMFPNEYISFVAGALLFAVQTIIDNEEDDSRFGRCLKKVLIKTPVLILLMLIGIYLAGTNFDFGGIYKILAYIAVLSKHSLVFRIIGVFLCLFVILNSPGLKKVLSLKGLSFLGKHSGYIYAFHWLVIISLGCGMYLLLAGHFPKWLLLIILFVLAIVIPIGLSYGCKALYKQVDKLENRIISAIK